VITSSEAFRQARCANARTLLKLASALAHEEWHVHNGSREREAYETQLLTLLHLGRAANHDLCMAARDTGRVEPYVRGRIPSDDVLAFVERQTPAWHDQPVRCR
jgi:hypothetical protein